MSGPVCRYIFTYNNYTPEGEEALKKYLTDNCKYAIFGHEVAPTTGTPHLQGFMNLKKKKRITTIQKDLKNLGVNMAILAAKGNDTQNQAYCSKDATDIFTVGEPVAKGQRSDLLEVSEKLRKRPLTEVVDEHPDAYIKYPRGMSALKEVYDKRAHGEELRSVHVTLLYGEPGTGKTFYANEIGKRHGKVYIVSPPSSGTVWWNEYEAEETIILDDFYGWLKPHDLFRFLDIYPLRLQVKGQMVLARYNRVFITANNNSDDWYKAETKYDRGALERRIHKRIYFYRDQMTKEVNIVVEKDEPQVDLSNPPVNEDLLKQIDIQ